MPPWGWVNLRCLLLPVLLGMDALAAGGELVSIVVLAQSLSSLRLLLFFSFLEVWMGVPEDGPRVKGV